MPYGMEGGDTPELDAKMERCVKQIMSRDPKLSKESAIRICKDSIQKAAKKGK